MSTGGHKIGGGGVWRRDIGALFARSQLNPDSNLAYGEGGAGTWSDGKLTTRIGRNDAPVRQVPPHQAATLLLPLHATQLCDLARQHLTQRRSRRMRRGPKLDLDTSVPSPAVQLESRCASPQRSEHPMPCRRVCLCTGQVLHALCEFGAPESILVAGAPHLGTDRLVRILKAFRARLVQLGVTIRWGTTIQGITVSGDAATGVTLTGAPPLSFLFSQSHDVTLRLWT